ncbi:MAG: translesion error-prone DNA polymerase V autoproteolytic subunit [Alistipes sp.]|nr:translesion error-prone DNA polymerase V autoproteolytic subunit [Alistipes sp.]
MEPYKIDCTTPIEADMLGEVRAGFPSPADEEPREKLDLLRLLVRHPASTFFFRIGGTSMVDAEMDEGDIIIVDRSIEPYNGCSAVCFIDGEFTVKRVEKHDDHIMLVAANPKFKPLRITRDNEFAIWGVVTYVIKRA